MLDGVNAVWRAVNGVWRAVKGVSRAVNDVVCCERRLLQCALNCIERTVG